MLQVWGAENGTGAALEISKDGVNWVPLGCATDSRSYIVLELQPSRVDLVPPPLCRASRTLPRLLKG